MASLIVLACGGSQHTDRVASAPSPSSAVPGRSEDWIPPAQMVAGEEKGVVRLQRSPSRAEATHLCRRLFAAIRTESLVALDELLAEGSTVRWRTPRLHQQARQAWVIRFGKESYDSTGNISCQDLEWYSAQQQEALERHRQFSSQAKADQWLMHLPLPSTARGPFGSRMDLIVEYGNRGLEIRSMEEDYDLR